MPQTTSTFKHVCASGDEVDVAIGWSFAGDAVQWVGNLSLEGKAFAWIGGRTPLAAGTEPSAPSAVLMDARRELWRRAADLDERVAELRRPTPRVEAAMQAGVGSVDLELELASDAARGDLLWREFFGDIRTSLPDEEPTLL